MDETQKTPAAPATGGGKKYKTMSFGEKLVFIGKSIVFVLTSGFAFPTIWTD